MSEPDLHDPANAFIITFLIMDATYSRGHSDVQREREGEREREIG